MRLLPLLFAVGVVLASSALVVSPAPAAHATSSCPPERPVADAFDSRALFGFSANAHAIDNPNILPAGVAEGGLAGDAALLAGPVLVCREPLNVGPDCRFGGVGLAPPIQTELVQMQLTGDTDRGAGMQVAQSPARASMGQVGGPQPDGRVGIPIRCHADPRTGDLLGVAFDAPVESFFDVFVVVTLEGLPPVNHDRPFRVTNVLCGLPAPNPDRVEPCQPPQAYAHIGGPQATASALGGGMQADFACHMPFFVPLPPPASCQGAMAPTPDGHVSGNFRLVLADVTDHPIVDVQTESVEAPPGYQLAVSPWSDPNGDGTWTADVVVLPPPGAPRCGQDEEVPIEILALSLHSVNPGGPVTLPNTFALRWCLFP